MITTINEFRKVFENSDSFSDQIKQIDKSIVLLSKELESLDKPSQDIIDKLKQLRDKKAELQAKQLHEEDSLHENVSPKDWDRMTKLYQTSGNYGDYEHIAKSIKDKKKAIARFVAGLKLAASNSLHYDESRNRFTGEFKEFGNRALQLGATVEEIQTVFDNAVVPGENDNKTSGEYIKAKKLDNRFVGTISRAILDAGYDINYIRTNGNAITQTGRDAMNNGRKWTIGYKAEILKDGVKVMDLVFDAITDEGDGPTSYVFNHEWRKIGKLELIKTILNKLQQ